MTDQEECELLRQLRATPRIFELLHESGMPDRRKGSELRVQKALRAEFPEAVVRGAILLAELRRKGAAKFSRAAEMWFDRKGLEQATPEAVARHKAQRFRGRVWDYCSGIGGDLIALAEKCAVIGVDQSQAACLRARWNAEVYGIAGRTELICADVATLTDRSGWLHVGPDRRAAGRASGRRAVQVEDCVPGLEDLLHWTREFAGGAIKLSPAANFAGKFPDAEIELVSLSGECKEATIWFGEAATAGLWRATVLPSGATLVGHPLDFQLEPGPLVNYLYDPDPAVVRAGLVDHIAEQSRLTRLDAAEEYLTSSSRIDTPFAQVFEVLADLPNNQREIRRYFRESKFGQVEIKCRHIPIEAEAVRRKLPLPGRDAGVLVFARVAGRARASCASA